MTNEEASQNARRPIAHIPSRTADSEGQVWHNLESLSGESVEEPNVEKQTPGPRASILTTSRSRTITKPGFSTSKASAGSPNDHMPPAAKNTSLVAHASAHRELTQSSSKPATVVKNPHQMQAKSKDVGRGVDGATSAAADKILTPPVHIQKAGQLAHPAASAPLTHTCSSTDDASNVAGLRGSSTKSRKKLKLQYIYIKLNSALPNEPPRVRLFVACDTVQKLFNQAWTGDVFGKAREVRRGGKLLTVEFRGSGRLPDEVHLVSEDDEEDFLNMRRALLKKDWWTNVDLLTATRIYDNRRARTATKDQQRRIFDARFGSTPPMLSEKTGTSTYPETSPP